MKILMLGIVAVVALFVVILLIGAALPAKHRASREVLLRKSPSQVYAVIRNFAGAASWRPDLQRVEMLGEVDGRVRFREHGKNGSITYEVMEEVPDERLVTRIVDRDLGYFGSWTYDLTPAEDGSTRIRITEDGEVPNIFFRFMSRFVFGHTSSMEAYLRAL